MCQPVHDEPRLTEFLEVDGGVGAGDSDHHGDAVLGEVEGDVVDLSRENVAESGQVEEDALLHGDVFDGEGGHGFFTDSYNKK